MLYFQGFLQLIHNYTVTTAKTTNLYYLVICIFPMKLKQIWWPFKKNKITHSKRPDKAFSPEKSCVLMPRVSSDLPAAFSM